MSTAAVCVSPADSLARLFGCVNFVDQRWVIGGQANLTAMPPLYLQTVIACFADFPSRGAG
jgi:hypothetical protein